MRGLQPPSPQMFNQFSVNNANQDEVIYSSLYDYTTYAAAGQYSLTFFQTPNGQSGKTYADTNMDLAGALPNPQKFIVQGIEVDFLPGSPAGSNVVDGIANNWNDTYNVFQSGYLEFQIGSKVYVRDAPIGVFPPTHRLAGGAAVAGTASTANTITLVDYASFAGRPYEIIPLSIPSQQNFSVKLVWSALQTVSAAARIGVRLNGYLYRASQ